MNNDKLHENECSYCHNLSRPTLDIGGGGITRQLICDQCVKRALESGEAVKKSIEQRILDAIPAGLITKSGKDAIHSLTALLQSARTQCIDLAAQLLAEQTGNAEMRRALLRAEWSGVGPLAKEQFYCPVCEAHSVNSEQIPHIESCEIGHALSTTCGQSFLDERERLRELLAYVRENVTVEVAAHGDCSCDIPAGDTPCVYCASIHFNERTDKQGTALQPQ